MVYFSYFDKKTCWNPKYVYRCPTEYLFQILGKFPGSRPPCYYFLVNFKALCLKHDLKSKIMFMEIWSTKAQSIETHG